MTHRLDLTLPAPERRRARGLAGRWRDLLYVPGPGFLSPLDAGCYRSTLLVVPLDGQTIRLSSFVVPAFGADLCRLRLEPVTGYRTEALGSFFEPSRRGLVYAMSADRRGGGARAPEQPGWCYAGPSLEPLLGGILRVRVLRERVSGAATEGAFTWVADRGLALTGAGGREVLLLADPDPSECVVFVAAPGLYRALLDPAAAAAPGATPAELLGYGDRAASLAIRVDVEPL